MYTVDATMSFDSYYWHGARIASAELERARARVAEAGDPAAFATLLRSADPVGVGIAMDQYHYADAFARHGPANRLAGYTEEVRARAREILRGPPSDPDLGAEPGANHASALGALMNLAEPQDADVIADALIRATTANLRFTASLAAGAALEKSIYPKDRFIEALENVVLDADLDFDSRSGALAALGRARSAPATESLVRVLGVSHLGLQATAALHLLDRDPDTHGDRILRLTLTWPEDPPYPASDVLELLAAQPRIGNAGPPEA
jgi:hypothetical protein